MTHPNPSSTRPAKGYIGLPMEGIIAAWYAKNTRSDQYRALAVRDRAQVIHRLVQTIPTGCRVLEVAPGPGYLSIELAQAGQYQQTGLDISQTFVDIARANARQAGVSVDFRLGNASDLPFPAESFDFIVCRAAFKNFSEPLRRDASRQEINAYVDTLGQNRLNTFFT